MQEFNLGRLLCVILLVIGTKAHIQIHVSSTENGNSDVISSGSVQRRWEKPGLPDIVVDYSSYSTFWIWNELGSANVTVKADSDNYNGPIVFVYQRPPEMEEEKHVYLEMQIDSEQKRSFTLCYTCIGDQAAAIEVEISDGLDRVAYYFYKNCMEGIRDDLSVTVNGVLAISNGVIAENWSNHTIALERQTSIRIWVEQGNQMIKDLVVKSALDTKIRGSAALARYITTDPIQLEILYNSLKPGTSNVSFRIRPFKQISFDIQYAESTNISVYTKGKITIGTSPEAHDIVHNNIVQQEYIEGINIGDSIFSTELYWYAEYNFKIQPPIITYDKQVAHSKILKPYLHYNSVDITKTPQKFILNYRCINSGTSEISITIPIGDKFPEFKLIKTCHQPIAIVEKGHFGTGYVFGVGIVICMLLSGLLVYRNKEKIYQVISTDPEQNNILFYILTKLCTQKTTRTYTADTIHINPRNRYTVTITTSMTRRRVTNVIFIVITQGVQLAKVSTGSCLQVRAPEPESKSKASVGQVKAKEIQLKINQFERVTTILQNSRILELSKDKRDSRKRLTHNLPTPIPSVLPLDIRLRLRLLGWNFRRAQLPLQMMRLHLRRCLAEPGRLMLEIMIMISLYFWNLGRIRGLRLLKEVGEEDKPVEEQARLIRMNSIGQVHQIRRCISFQLRFLARRPRNKFQQKIEG